MTSFRSLVIAGLLLEWSSFATASPQSDWRLFRDRYPYHAQMIAFGQADANGSRTIVISEPPPSIGFKDFTARYAGTIQRPVVATQRIGFDGWVKDIVGVVPPMRDAERRALVDSLSRDLFGTAYKAYSVDITSAPPARDTFDLTVGSNALRSWLGLTVAARTDTQMVLTSLAWIVGSVSLLAMIKRRQMNPWLALVVASVGLGYFALPSVPPSEVGAFKPLHGGDAQTLKRLLANPAPGVYHSEKPGVVALVIRRHSPLNEAVVAMREFALDSDLILGGIGSANAIAVLGREREASVRVLPPLRTETLLQLAAAGTDELAQSYERTRVFAGSTGPEHRDWAPIYLSPQLHDTEYGSLLNITDQLLKSWSEHGEIEYVNFRYPKPEAFPFETGLLEHAKVNVVTYNWNTKGVGYSEDHDGYDVVAFSRTGALPVDYLGEQDARMRADEEKGYEYFAGTTHDQNLARVVQYAAVYQIWRHFGVQATWSAPSRSHEGADALLPLARELIGHAKDVDVDSARTRFRDDPEFLKELDGFEKIQSRLRQAGQELGEDLNERVAHYLVYPRDYPADDASDAQQASFRLSHALSSNEIVRMIARRNVPVAFQLYARAEGREDPPGWIKTPSVVLSWQVGKNAGNGEGGHNLSSRISRFAEDTTLTPGAVRVSEEGGERVLYYHPDDAGKIGQAARPFARNLEQDADQLAHTVEAQLRATVVDRRAMREALHLADRPALGTRGLRTAPGTSVASTPPWIVGGGVPRAHADVLSNINEASIFPMVIERSDKGFVISRAGQAQVVEAADSSSALDAVVAATRADANGRTVHLHFKNMTDDQATAFSQVAEMHAADRKPVAIRTSIEADANSMKVIAEIRDGRWNLAKPEIRAVHARVGELRDAIDVDVAFANQAGRSLTVRFKVAFETTVRVTTELLVRVTNALQTALAGVARDTDMLVAARRVMKSLRESDESIRNVHVRIVGEAGEIHVVRNAVATPDALSE